MARVETLKKIKIDNNGEPIKDLNGDVVYDIIYPQTIAKSVFIEDTNLEDKIFDIEEILDNLNVPEFVSELENDAGYITLKDSRNKAFIVNSYFDTKLRFKDYIPGDMILNVGATFTWEFPDTLNFPDILNTTNITINYGSLMVLEQNMTINVYDNILTVLNDDIQEYVSSVVSNIEAQIPSNLSELSDDIGIALIDDIPSKLSDLSDDLGVALTSDIPTKISDLENDENYVKKSEIGNVLKYKGSVTDYTDLPLLNNEQGDVYNVINNNGSIPAGTNYAWSGNGWDPLGGDVDLSSYATKSYVTSQGYITINSIPTKLSDFTNDSNFITVSSIPTKLSEFTNDSNFITLSSVPTKVSDLNNDSKFSSIKNGLNHTESLDLTGYFTSTHKIDTINILKKDNTSGVILEDKNINENKYAQITNLSTVAFSGSYNDLLNIPVANLSVRGGWSSSVSYNVNDVVVYLTGDRNTYYCKAGNTNVLPTDTNYWTLFVSKGEKGDTGATGATGVTGSIGPKGDDGDTPYISGGKWWVGNVNTGIDATGPQGPPVDTSNLVTINGTETITGSKSFNFGSKFSISAANTDYRIPLTSPQIYTTNKIYIVGVQNINAPHTNLNDKVYIQNDKLYSKNLPVSNGYTALIDLPGITTNSTILEVMNAMGNGTTLIADAYGYNNVLPTEAIALHAYGVLEIIKLSVNRALARYTAKINSLSDTRMWFGEFQPAVEGREWSGWKEVQKVITSINQIGLTYPTTTVAILNKLFTLGDRNIILMLGLSEASGANITDLPSNNGLLEIRVGEERVRWSIEYNHEIGSGTSTKYIGSITRSGNTVTSVTWEEVITSSKAQTITGIKQFNYRTAFSIGTANDTYRYPLTVPIVSTTDKRFLVGVAATSSLGTNINNNVYMDANNLYASGLVIPGQFNYIDIGKKENWFWSRFSGESWTFTNTYTGGGWARSLMSMKNADDTNYFSIGGRGNGQSFTNFYIGPAFDNPWITLSNSIAEIKKPLTVTGKVKTTIATTSGDTSDTLTTKGYVDAIQLTPGPQGPAGQQGPQGVPGTPAIVNDTLTIGNFRIKYNSATDSLDFEVL